MAGGSLTRQEQAALLALVAVILAGSAWRSCRQAPPGRTVWVEAGHGIPQPAATLTPPPEGSGPALGAPPPAAPIRPGEAAIDLNKASARELDRLPRIGPAKAAAILRHRDMLGGFKSVDDLASIPGFGAKTVELIRPHVKLSPLGAAAKDGDTSTSPPLTSTEVHESPPVRSEAASTSPAAEAAPVPPPGPPSAPAGTPPEKPKTARTEKAPSGSGEPAGGSSEAEAAESPSATARVNPNTASAALLETLPGIGPKLAQRIIARRQIRPYRRAEDLLEVSGIGPKTLVKMRPRLVFEPEK